MKQIKHILLTICLAVMPQLLLAQITSVHGTVKDDFGELMGATICEIDASGRIVESTISDMSGNFSMKIHNAKANKLRITYVGCKPKVLPIDKTTYNITMNPQGQIKEVVVTAKARGIGNNLSVPEKEISYAKQTIDMKQFEGLAFTSVDEALQGQIAGLDIVAGSGNLGSGSTMRLRGVSSISTLTGGNPLIVVDGNIWNVDTSNFDLATSNDEKFAELLNINPEDIASITVLKDASATAVYGSQGGNGVIEITTKRGRRGKTHISYSTKYTATYQGKGYDLLNGDDYTMLLKESYYNPQQNDNASDIPELNYDRHYSEYEQFNNNTDWVKAVTQWGLRQNRFVTLSGGGEKANFHISAGWDHETGTIIKQKLDRISMRVNLDYNVSERIRVSTNFSMTYTKNNRNSDNLLAIALKKMPNMSIYEQDPETGENTNRYYTMLQPPVSSQAFYYDQLRYVNPVASAHLAKNVSSTYNLSPELVINYRLLGLDDNSWRLDWRGSMYMNVFNEYSDRFYPSELVTVPWSSGVNTSYSGSSKSVSFNTKQTLTLIPYFHNPAHSLMAMARFELNSGTSNGQSTDGRGTPGDGIHTPEAGKITSMGSYFGEWRSLAWSFSAHYAYKSRYMLDLSLRADGTTKFGPGRRWGLFPGTSVRWNISEEPWVKPLRNWLSMWSLRAGWGRVGHQPRQDYLYTSKYGMGTRYIDQTSMYPINIRLTDLQWENVSSFNFGMDYGLFDRVNLTFEIYRSTTTNMLMGNFRIPSNSGFTTVAYHNNGSMRNKGWEFHLNTNRLIRAGKFTMDMNVNFGNNRNEILTMDENVLNALNSTFNYNNRELLTRVELHSPFGAIYGFRSKGVYQYKYQTFADMSREEQDAFIAAGKTAPVARNAQGNVVYNEKGEPVRMMFNYTNDASGRNYKFEGGDAIYEDVNHDGNIDALDIVYLGSSLPKLTGGFGFVFSYGAWRLNTSFVYRIGNKIVNMARLDNEAMVSNDNQSQAVNYRWRKDGDVTSIPRAMYGSTSNYNTLVSDRFVEDGSYLRMGWLQLSYDFDRKLISRWGLSKLSLYFSANNLFVLTKYSGVDPDVGYGGYGAATDWGQTPRPRSYTLGLSVSF